MIKKLRYKISELRYKFCIWRDIKAGYIDENGTPLKCPCGCTDLEDYNEYYLDGYGSTLLEFQVRCKKCGRELGHWAYGYWEM